MRLKLLILMEEARRELEYVRYLPGTPFEQIRTLTKNMLDENNMFAFFDKITPLLYFLMGK
ncbi:hypothetical protein EDD58_108126 [Hazenella coriacea]|uniref:Uncharacterized protein n=1 Tax=Hazenella coriacea TaxID=1179467 RepID=A0A4R3L336_9BACL|nr:hypothetical protein EDD58_108126 [Hazenella coriacea]